MSDGTEQAATFSIGEAAQRLGVEISTLRWWEKRGLLTPGTGVSGRRRYSAADLRQIALVQLLQDTALMSLDEIRTALSGGPSRPGGWREAAQARLAVCDVQLARLRSARAYLSHALTCPSEDPVRQCPHLAEEIDKYLTAAGERRDRTIRAQHRSRRRSEALTREALARSTAEGQSTRTSDRHLL